MDKQREGDTTYVEWDLGNYRGLLEEISVDAVEDDPRALAMLAIAATVNDLTQEVRKLRLAVTDGDDPKWRSPRDTRERSREASSRPSEGEKRDQRKRRN
jgi:hypothetical protein